LLADFSELLRHFARPTGSHILGLFRGSEIPRVTLFQRILIMTTHCTSGGYRPFGLATLMILGLLALAVRSATAEDPPAGTPDAAAGDKEPTKATALPLSKVVLFSSGVGFFEHDGHVTGDAHVDLRFNVQDINDLLKSMVLQDLNGGKISTVNYGSKDPITKTLKTFAIDLTTQPTLADLLKQIRGEAVEVDTPQPITGTIIGVEKRKVRIGKDESTEADYLNLLTADGLRSVSLENVVRIKLSNEKLNHELQLALAVLATGHDTDKKTVSLHFLGEGKRAVRVGYIQEAPIWKTSYRLVLKDEDPPFLQGWAIVENTTEQDWNDVALTLISGRPISFVMDLYQPLFVNRPVVVQELYASLRPQTYDQDIAGKDADFRRMANEEVAKGEGRMMMRKSAAAAPGMAMAAGDRGYGGGQGSKRDEQLALNLRQGGQSMAQAGNVGELFKYEIGTPVTLPRHQSAMLPIVNDSVKGKKVSIYNPNVQAKHPLNGLKLTNSTPLHLMQGPITVFDGGTYAGDARIEDLPPGGERLLSYALDLDTEVAPESVGHPEQLIGVRIVKGTLYAQRKYQRTEKYTVKNSGHHAKEVLIEYPHDGAWTLIEPKEPTEKTRDMYRFAVKAEPGKPANFAVEEERTDQQQFALTNVDNGTIVFYMNSQVAAPKVKAALAEVIRRKQAIDDLVSKRQSFERQVQVVDQEQSRIRQNMAQLDRNSDLYNRYVKKFGEQEDQVDTLRKQILGVQAEETGARKALDQYLETLDLS
jgi:hypothetical protein